MTSNNFDANDGCLKYFIQEKGDYLIHLGCGCDGKNMLRSIIDIILCFNFVGMLLNYLYTVVIRYVMHDADIYSTTNQQLILKSVPLHK